MATHSSVLAWRIPGMGEPGGKNPPANAGDMDSIPGSGRSPGEGNGKPLQYSCLGNPRNTGKESAQGCLPKRLLGRPDEALGGGNQSQGTTGSSGSLSCGVREVKSPYEWRGGARHCSRVMVVESGLNTMKKDARGLSRVAAGNPGFPRLVPVTSGSFSGCL